MLIQHWPSSALSVEGFFGPIAHSFELDNLPMALVLGGMVASMVTLFSYRALAPSWQTARLAEELRRAETLRAELQERAERLAQGNEELAKLEEANRRSVQYMVHDFKTALSCIGGFSEVLLDKPALQRDPGGGRCPDFYPPTIASNDGERVRPSAAGARARA